MNFPPISLDKNKRKRKEKNRENELITTNNDAVKIINFNKMSVCIGMIAKNGYITNLYTQTCTAA